MRRVGIGLRLRVGRCGVELLPRFLDPGSGLLPPLLGPLLRLVRFCGRERLVGGREFGIGAGLERFQLAQRRSERCRLARRCRGNFLCLVGRLCGLRGLAGERLNPRRRSGDGLRFRDEKRRVGKLDRGWIVRRDDHPHPDPRLVEQLIGKAEGHPHAAVRGRIPGQRPAVQRDAVPGDALHVRHPGVVIHVRAVIDLFIDNSEDAGGRLAFLGAGRYGRAQDPAVRVVENDLLGLDRYDRHDRLTGVARRRRLWGWRGARLFRRGAGSQRRQRCHRRKRDDGSRPPMAYRHGGLRRRQSIDHPLLQLKSLSALTWIKCQIAILGN